MTKFKKRLPVLLLALVLTIMPVMLAVPASADVLVGSEFSGPYEFTFDSVVFPFPDTVSSSGSFFIWKYKDVYYLHDCSSVNVKSIYFVDGAYPSIYVAFDGGTNIPRYRFVDGSWSSDGVFNSPVGGSVPSIGIYGIQLDVVDASALSYVTSVSFVPGSSSVGILSVFSGICSWLSGALQNISTMFWTADGGMTVLGYLAVASLAFAVILLIFYLIAGWLKFK